MHGTLGNTSFSFDGRARVRTLLWNGNWVTLAKELSSYQKFNRGYGMGVMRAHLLGALIPKTAYMTLRRFCRRNNEAVYLGKYSGISLSLAKRTGAVSQWVDNGTILQSWRWLTSRQRRAFVFNKTFHGTGFDAPLMVLARHAVDLRDPYGDRRIVEFCMDLPEEYYFNKGMPRRFARLGSMRIIPDAIAMDPTNGRQDIDWLPRIRNDAAAINQALEEFAGDADVSDYLDVSTLQRKWRHFQQGVDKGMDPDIVSYVYQVFIGSLSMGKFIQWFRLSGAGDRQ